MVGGLDLQNRGTTRFTKRAWTLGIPGKTWYYYHDNTSLLSCCSNLKGPRALKGCSSKAGLSGPRLQRLRLAGAGVKYTLPQTMKKGLQIMPSSMSYFISLKFWRMPYNRVEHRLQELPLKDVSYPYEEVNFSQQLVQTSMVL